MNKLMSSGEQNAFEFRVFATVLLVYIEPSQLLLSMLDVGNVHFTNATNLCQIENYRHFI